MSDSAVKVCFPAGVHEIEEKMSWTEDPVAKALWETGKAEPGVEIKIRAGKVDEDLPRYAEMARTLPRHHQVHLPWDIFDADWSGWFSHEESKVRAVEPLIASTFKPLRQAKPFCAIFHSASFNQNQELPYNSLKRFLCPVGAEEWLFVLKRQIELFGWLVSEGMPIGMENMLCIGEIGREPFPHEFYTTIQIGHLPSDLSYIQKKAKIPVCVWDMDHLQLTYCFYEQQDPFEEVPKSEDYLPPLSQEETELWQKTSLFVRKGEYPRTSVETRGNEAWRGYLRVLQPQVVHVQGDIRLTPRGEKRQHSPLFADDGHRIKQIYEAIVCGASIFTIESVSCSPHCCPSRSPDAMRESYIALCQILLDFL